MGPSARVGGFIWVSSFRKKFSTRTSREGETSGRSLAPTNEVCV